MVIVNPSENISTIISVLDRAKEFVVLVSPYTGLKGWDNLKDAINNASKRGVEVSYYVRQEVGIEGTDVLDVNIFEVPDLHAKMFFSEKEAVIGSFHLRNNDDINWAYVLNYPKEYDDMKNFFEKNIEQIAILFKENKMKK